MITKKQKRRTVILVIVLVIAIIAGVFGISYALNGYTSPFMAKETAQTEVATEPEVNLTITEAVQEKEPEVKPEDSKKEEPKKEDAKTEEAKKEDTKQEETKTETVEESETLLPKMEYGGALKVVDGKLCDKKGNQIQLAGVSSHGLSWYPEYITADSVSYLRNTLGINVIRLAVYTSDYNGYCIGGDQVQESIKDTIDAAVLAATENEMYVIIDWHTLNDANPNEYKKESIQFFGEMVRRYKDNENIIYEICNEPNGDTTWADIKSYANEVIPVIRNVDGDAVILCGTPNWCQDIDVVAEDPLAFENIMYTFHFYSSTHKSMYRNRLSEAVESGLPVFISEFGLSEADGKGKIDKKEASKWLELIEEYKLSAVAWNLSNKDETCALIKANCDKLNNWTYDDLSDQGQILYDYLSTKENTKNDN